MESTLFISYAHEDLDAAERLYGELRVAGMNPWIDAQKLIGGQNWRQEITSAIRQSDFFIALFSKNAVNKKGYVQREIREAMEVLATVPAGAVFFIPVRLEPCEIAYPMIADLHRIDLFPEWSAGLRDIQRAVRGRLDIVTSDCPPDNSVATQDNLHDAYCKIRTTIIQIITENTGYPRGSLNEDGDLEAEFGIDSIRRVGIILQIERCYGVHLLISEAFRACNIRALALQVLFALNRREDRF